MLDITIAPLREWQAACDCGWIEQDLDRENVIKQARVHRREDHAGQANIRTRFGRGTAELGAIISPALAR